MKLEIGKSYKNRRGEVVRIVRFERCGNDLYPYYDENENSYKENGSYNVEASINDPIKEVTNAPMNLPYKPQKYMVFSPQDNVPRVEHDTLEIAVTEAKRLAGNNPKKLFHVIQIVKTFKANIVVEEV